MKYSPTGWAAEVRRDDGTTYTVPVEEWSAHNGDALIVNPTEARLMVAKSHPAFVRLVPYRRIVAMTPTTGQWGVSTLPTEDAPGFDTAPAAWVLDGEGHVWPVIAEPSATSDDNGEPVLTPTMSGRYRILPPHHRVYPPRKDSDHG